MYFLLCPFWVDHLRVSELWTVHSKGDLLLGRNEHLNNSKDSKEALIGFF